MSQLGKLFDRLGTLTIANLNEWCNELEADSAPALYDQMVRVLQSAKEKIEGLCAKAVSRVAMAEADVRVLKEKIEIDQEHLDWLVGNDDQEGGKDDNHLIEPTAAGLVQANKDLVAAEASLKDAQAVLAKSRGSVREICIRHADMVKKASDFRRQDETTRANEEAAKALKQVGEMTANAGTGAASIDNIERRGRERAATAKAQLDMALGTTSAETGLPTLEQSKADREVQQLIASRRAAVAASKAAANATP